MAINRSEERSFVALILALLCCCTADLRADPPGPWLWRNPLPHGNQFSGIAYGNGTFVGVANAGTITTSSDGTNWTSQTFSDIASFGKSDKK